MFDITIEGKQPIYEQLCAGITRLISSGALPPGEKLPAVREVAKSLGINPNTVQKAYSQLERSGLIYSVPAKGNYVSSEESTRRAVKDDALRALESSLVSARDSGITEEEAAGSVKKIWNN